MVAPFMGAWIETPASSAAASAASVAPFMGAWIETRFSQAPRLLSVRSHPSWVRGLKLEESEEDGEIVWVAPFMGAWIETRDSRTHRAT